MQPEPDTPGRQHGGWSTKKKDKAPRGVRRYATGAWGIRYACGAGHFHKEIIGHVKGDAISVYHRRRLRVQSEPGWCPQVEAAQKRANEAARVTFSDFADDYLKWAKTHKRSWKTNEGQIKAAKAAFGEKRLDEITTGDIERFRDSLLSRVSNATSNRYRDLLSAVFKRAERLGFIPKRSNPVTDVPKFKENNQRLAYLGPDEEAAVLAALPAAYRPDLIISINTGLRWSEQMNLRWQDVDLLTGFITVPRSKHGESRRVPINSAVRSALIDLGTGKRPDDDGSGLVFPGRPAQADKYFPRAVETARAALKAAGKDSSRLGGYTWHGNRHTFASRCVMAGADLRTLQELGGWKSLAMLSRYSHLAPGHLQAAVERIVTPVVAAPPVAPVSGIKPLYARLSDQKKTGSTSEATTVR